jgi:hypothetical protein
MNVNSNSLLGNRDTREYNWVVYSSYTVCDYDITFETVNDFEEHNSPSARPKPLLVHSFIRFNFVISENTNRNRRIESNRIESNRIE